MALLIVPHIHRATHRIGLYIERSGLDVSQAEAHILAHLAEAGDCSIAELHTALSHKRSTLTSVLDRLAAKKLIRREVRADDRRSFDISLTPQGKKIARKVHRHLQSLESAVLKHTSPQTLELIRSLLEAL